MASDIKVNRETKAANEFGSAITVTFYENISGVLLPRDTYNYDILSTHDCMKLAIDTHDWIFEGKRP